MLLNLTYFFFITMVNIVSRTMDFENNLVLYFYSAMPQVLGTMLALIGAFYPSRSQQLKEEIQGIHSIIRDNILKAIRDDSFNKWYKSSIAYMKMDPNIPTHEHDDFEKKILALSKEESDFYGSLIEYEAVSNVPFSLERLFNKSEMLKLSFANAEREFSERVYQTSRKYFKSIQNKSDFLNKFYGSRYDNSEIIMKQVNFINKRIRNLLNIKKNLKALYIFNGIILTIFINSFIFLSYTSHSFMLHRLFVIGGAILASLSICTMILYIYKTISEKQLTSLFNIK
jgi:hypothetical protein